MKAVGAVLVFESGRGLDYDAVVERLRTRLHLIPRYMPRVGMAPNWVASARPLVLLLSVLLGVGAAIWGWLLRRRRKYLWAAFAFDLPILPVILTLAVLADVYV